LQRYFLKNTFSDIFELEVSPVALQKIKKETQKAYLSRSLFYPKTSKFDFSTCPSKNASIWLIFRLKISKSAKNVFHQKPLLSNIYDSTALFSETH